MSNFEQTVLYSIFGKYMSIFCFPWKLGEFAPSVDALVLNKFTCTGYMCLLCECECESFSRSKGHYAPCLISWCIIRIILDLTRESEIMNLLFITIIFRSTSSPLVMRFTRKTITGKRQFLNLRSGKVSNPQLWNYWAGPNNIEEGGDHIGKFTDESSPKGEIRYISWSFGAS